MSQSDQDHKFEIYDDLPREEIGARLKAAREKAGYVTAWEAARASGIEQPHSYYRLEAGKRAPSFQTLYRLIGMGGYDPKIIFAPYERPAYWRAKGLTFDQRDPAVRPKRRQGS